MLSRQELASNLGIDGPQLSQSVKKDNSNSSQMQINDQIMYPYQPEKSPTSKQTFGLKKWNM